MVVPFVDSVIPAGLLNTATTPTNNVATTGSLVTFNYLYHKPGHDAYPLVLVTDISTQYLRGMNLHYLTFPVIKNLIYPAPGRSVCNSPQFTYQYLKSKGYINRGQKGAFRQYKVSGISRLRKLDCAAIVNALAISRSFDPNEIEAIRKTVREQIRRIVNFQAAPTGEMPI